MQNQRSLLGVRNVRYFAHHEHEPTGKASFRKTGNPGWYNKRFERSTSVDGGYVDNASTIWGADGFEPRQTPRDPSKFNYSADIFS